MDKAILRIGICEDKDEDSKHLQQLISESGIQSYVRCFSSGEDLLASFQAGMYDLIFMDIYMTGLSGIETVKAIRKTDETVIIAFTTTSTDHTLESYNLDALRYLVKPVDEGGVKKTLALVTSQRKTRPAINITLAGGETTNIFVDTIVYFEIKNHVVELHTTQSVMTTSQSARLDKFEEMLPVPPFFRPHHSFLVNLDYVEKADKEISAFIMKNGDEVNIKKRDFVKCKEALHEWRLAKTGRFAR